MQPQGLLGQLNQSMMQGQPELNQISSTSPAGDPSLQPPMSPASPDANYSLIHKAAQSRGMDLSGHPQLQASFAQPSNPGAPTSSSPSSYSAPTPGDGQVEMPVTEAELLIKALSTRLKTISGHEEKLRDAAISMLKPEVQEAAPQQ